MRHSLHRYSPQPCATKDRNRWWRSPIALSLSRVSDQASLSHAMKDNYVRDQLSSISASVLSWPINRPDHLAMPTLSQLSFQAEGYRHLVCLIANYGSGRIGPTIGSRRRNGVLYCDIVIALSQTCPAIHTWYYGTYDHAWLRAGSRDGAAGSAGTIEGAGALRGRPAAVGACRLDYCSRIARGRREKHEKHVFDKTSVCSRGSLIMFWPNRHRAPFI